RANRPALRLASADGSLPERPRSPALDDEALLAALRRSDPGAATALHDRARPLVDRTVARLLGRGDMDREDVAQLAMIELVTTIGRFRGDCSLDGWISMITARVVYKHLRRRKTERRIFAAPTLEEPAAPAFQQRGNAPLLRGVVDRVRSHLQTLEPSKAWTFLLHDVWGYDLQEIAQIMGVRVTAAQTRLSRGRRELHERIAEDPELSEWIEETGGVT
ncbi:MAG: RNA polymerase sigma factor, partial [Polyangiales bacterium]